MVACPFAYSTYFAQKLLSVAEEGERKTDATRYCLQEWRTKRGGKNEGVQICFFLPKDGEMRLGEIAFPRPFFKREKLRRKFCRPQCSSFAPLLFLHKICGEGGIVSGGERATSLSGIEFETFVKVVSRSAEAAAAAAAAFPPSV